MYLIWIIPLDSIEFSKIDNWKLYDAVETQAEMVKVVNSICMEIFTDRKLEDVLPHPSPEDGPFAVGKTGGNDLIAIDLNYTYLAYMVSSVKNKYRLRQNQMDRLRQ